MQNVQQRCFELLPEDAAYHIFENFKWHELVRYRNVCRAWQVMAGLPSLWRPLYLQEFGSKIPRQISQLNWKQLFIAQTIMWHQEPRQTNLANKIMGSFLGNPIWAICLKEGKMIVINQETRKVQQILETGNQGFTGNRITFIRPSGDFLVAGFTHGLVQIWNWKTGVMLESLTGYTQNTSMECEGSFFVMIAEGSPILKVIEVPSGLCFQTFTHPGCTQVKIQDGHIVSYSPGTLRIWNFRYSSFHREFKPWMGGPMQGFTLYDKKIFVWFNSGLISIWDLETLKFQKILVGHKDPIKQMEIDENILLTLTDKNDLMLWDYKTEKCLFSLTEPNDTITAVHRDQSFLAYGTRRGKIAIWNYKKNVCLHSFRAPDGHFVQSLKINDGTLVAKVRGHGLIVWDFIGTLPDLTNLAVKKAQNAYACIVM